MSANKLQQEGTLFAVLEARCPLWRETVFAAVEETVASMGDRIFAVEWANKHARAIQTAIWAATKEG